MNDLRSALRQLTKSPGFSVVAILTLALGLGANITIFSMISAFFFQPLPVQQPEQLAYITQRTPSSPFPHGNSWKDYADIREHGRELFDVLALNFTPAQLSVEGRMPDRTWIEAVSGNYFSLLGVEPALGRLFLPGEGEKLGADPIVVLSHDYWQNKLGADPTIVGRAMNLNGRPFTVVGIAPAWFHSAQWSMAPGAFVPATMLGQFTPDGAGMLESRGAVIFKTLARLEPGVTVDAARASLNVLAARLAADFPREHPNLSFQVVPELRSRPEPSFSSVMPVLAFLFMGMAVLVLAIACANVANLMFARALARQRELGIRAAVGATRGQLLRLLLIESTVLAAVAGGIGMIAALSAADAIRSLAPQGDIPIVVDQSLDSLSIAFTVVAALAAGLVTGIVPALRATRLDLQSTLKSGAGSAPALDRHRFRSFLVIGQVACCVIVLVCGGYFAQSLRQLSRIQIGFHPDNLLTASIDLGMQGYPEARGRQFHRELIDRVAALPGVESAALATAVPFDTSAFMHVTDFGAEGRIIPGLETGEDGYVNGGYNRIDESYLHAARLTLLRGRNFTRQDDAGAPRVALINETLARQLWPEGEAIGKRFRFHRGGAYVEVVGIVRDGKYRMLNERPTPFAYLPLAQNYAAPVTVHLRTRGDPVALIADLRNTLATLDPDLPIYAVRTMEEHLRTSAFALMPLRLGSGMLSVQALLGLGLAVMGIYGVVAYTVSQRTREIGIRMALGAARTDVLRMVIRGGLRLTVIGLAIGLVIAFALLQVLSGLLYGLSSMTIPLLLGSVFLLGGVALLASWIPARRAMAIEPVEALRAE